jgi:spermidine synthase
MQIWRPRLIVRSMVFRLRSTIFLILIYAAFFASGASSLVAEVTWNRMLIVVVGNSMSATAMIVAVFMGGLGLGSFVGGKAIARRRPSLVPYLLLEVAIGAYIVLSPSLFDLLAHVFSVLADIVPNRAGLTAVRLIVTLGALFLPAFFMGATFPAMISGTAPDSPFKRTARIGFLYSINTLGAAVGCFVAGYHLLFELGVQVTLIVAFGLNIVAAVCAFGANMARRPTEQAVPSLALPASSPPPEEGVRRFLRVASFGIGFVSLAYEVVLTRLGILYLGNVASVFALVLTGFLLGTGISAVFGTWIYGVLRRRTEYSERLFGLIALGAGALVTGIPYFLLSDVGISADRLARSGVAAQSPLRVLGVIVAPTVLIGALLPVAIRMLQSREKAESTRESATLYALNTVGGLLGAGLANHLLVPLMGLHGVLIFLTSICVAVALLNLFPPGRNIARRSAAVTGVAALALVLTWWLPDMKSLYAGHIAEAMGASSADVLLVHEGSVANVAVLDINHEKKATYRDMYLNGIEEASTRYWHTQLFKLLGTLPVMSHESDKPKDVLVIAFGAGITAGSVLAFDDVASLDVVDLNPDIEGINNLFTSVNGDVFHKPRFHFYNDDGRNYLVTSGKRYDVIISDSTHPRAYDSWILYTREFYKSVKERLRPDGVFAQWVPVDPSMQGQLFRIHLNTFRSVFTHSTFWYVYGSDQAFLLATPGSFTLDARRMKQKLDRLPEWFRAGDYQIDSVARLAGFFWMDEAAMSRMIGNETRVNTDDRHFFDKQSAVWPLPPQWRLQRYQASVLPHIRNGDDGLFAAIDKKQLLGQMLARYRFYPDRRYLVSAYCMDPEDRNVRYWMKLEYSPLPDYSSVCRATKEQ